jgi:hypothetical protein
MVSIYVLELENNKFYIGKTNEPNFRLEQHFNGYGSSWTKKYKPIKILQIISNCDNFDEDKYTLKFMSEHGINNVRGGSFCEINLPEDNKKTIGRMLNGSTDKCYICGMKGHFANKCIFDQYDFCSFFEHENLQFFNCDICNIGFDSIKSFETHKTKYCKRKNANVQIKKDKCFRCGKTGHYSDVCDSTTHVNGKVLENSDDESMFTTCAYCAKKFHSMRKLNVHEKDCEARTYRCICCDKQFKSESEADKHYMQCKKKTTKTKNNCCLRCGRIGHFANDCYAKTHENGNLISDSDEDLIWQCEYCNKEFDYEDDCLNHEKKCKTACYQKNNNKCYRCKREGHYASECYATTDANGKKIYEKSYCY